MDKCVKCGVDVEKDEAYTINDKIYCEDCAIAIRSAGNPSKRCGE